MHPRARRAQRKRRRRKLKRWRYDRAIRRIAECCADFIRYKLQQPSITERLFAVLDSEEA